MADHKSSGVVHISTNGLETDTEKKFKLRISCNLNPLKAILMQWYALVVVGAVVIHIRNHPTT